MKKLSIFIILLIILIGNSATAATVLNFEHDENVGSITHEILLDLSSRVDKATDGQIKIEIIPACSSSGGNITTMIENVQMGLLDGALISSSIFALWDPRLEVLNLPFAVEDMLEMEKVGRYSPVMIEMYKSFKDKYSLTVVDAWTRALRQTVNDIRPIEKLEDFKGP